jgi:hypothetical protein
MYSASESERFRYEAAVLCLEGAFLPPEVGGLDLIGVPSRFRCSLDPRGPPGDLLIQAPQMKYHPRRLFFLYELRSSIGGWTSFQTPFITH